MGQTGAEKERLRAENQRLEKALRESEARYRTLTEAARDMIFIVDREDRVEYVNRFAAESVCSTPAEIQGRRRSEFFLGADGERQARGIRRVLETGEALYVQAETRFRERVVWLDSWLVPLRDEGGRVRAVLGISRDITRQKAAEAEHQTLQVRMLQAQKLESLGVLAGGIAHDFNNLLTGVLGYASLGLACVPPGSEAQAHLREIELAARRAAELIDQLLAYSGRGRFVLQAVDLSRLVREMSELLRLSISKKVEVRYELADDLPAVDGDPGQLRQIVMNLLLNASEAIGERAGVVTLRTGARTCDRACLDAGLAAEALTEGEYVFLEVSDSGPGIPAAIQERIFEPFFSTKFAGRGLGLAAVMGAVRSHHGLVQVHSPPGQGATFRVLLPTSGKPVRGEVGRAPPVTWRVEGRVLVVDDEPSVLGLASSILTTLGFTALTARDGLEALEVLRREQGRVELVLLDLTMPRMDGLEACREIRRLWPAARVLLSSGYSLQEADQRFAGLSFCGFVHKPYTRDELVEAVRHCLVGPQPPSEPADSA